VSKTEHAIQDIRSDSSLAQAKHFSF